jgi:hypothetical protein
MPAPSDKPARRLRAKPAARAGKPVAVITPEPAAQRSPLSPDDPLFNLDKFGFDGPGGKLTNAEIDRIV